MPFPFRSFADGLIRVMCLDCVFMITRARLCFSLSVSHLQSPSAAVRCLLLHLVALSTWFKVPIGVCVCMRLLSHLHPWSLMVMVQGFLFFFFFFDWPSFLDKLLMPLECWATKPWIPHSPYLTSSRFWCCIKPEYVSPHLWVLPSQRSQKRLRQREEVDAECSMVHTCLESPSVRLKS